MAIKTGKNIQAMVEEMEEKVPKIQIEKRRFDIGREYFLGQWVIVRTYSAGVHMGKIVDIYENRVALTESRRMRFFKNLDDGDSLSHIAATGVHPDSKMTLAIGMIMLEWVEIIPITDEALMTFNTIPYEVVGE